MKIRMFGAGNYKSFFQLGQFELTSGFNIVTGQNAAGKTALLELMGLQFPPRPHRSMKTVPNKGDVTDGISVAYVQLELTNPEMKRMLRNMRLKVSLPVINLKTELARELTLSNWDGPAFDRFLRWWLDQPGYVFKLG